MSSNSSLLIFAALSLLMMSMLALDLFAASARERGAKSWVIAANLAVPLLLGITLMSATFARGPITSKLDLYKSGANYAPAVTQSERQRIVTTAAVESRRMHAVAAGIAVAGFGIALTWGLSLFAFLSIAASILLLTELSFVLAEPAGLRFGSLEWLVGLGLAATWVTFHAKSRERDRSLPIAWSIGCISLIWLAIARATSQTLDHATGIDLQNAHEALLALSAVLGLFFARLALKIEYGVGPRWEAAYLHSFTGVGVAAMTAFALFLAPQGLDRLEFLAQIERTHVKVQSLIQHHLGERQPAAEHIQLPAQIWLDVAREYKLVAQFADRGKASGRHIDETTRQHQARIEALAHHAEILALIEESKLQLTQVDEQLNRDPKLAAILLQKFWTRTYPTLESHIEQARPNSDPNSISDSDPNSDPNSGSDDTLTAEIPLHPAAFNSVHMALQSDFAAITAAAIELEVRRTDLWLAWVNRLAPDRRASMAVAAQDYARRLKGLRQHMANTGLDDDPRLASLDSSLEQVRNMNADRAPSFTDLLPTTSSTKSRTKPTRHSSFNNASKKSSAPQREPAGTQTRRSRSKGPR
ncbi:MAG TPA: hypothetical protein PLZ57_08130 [Pseudobdellovibrionaceae bacterium]|nr:hypothetical protein [Pseudobdellovibrionaceae bacterium]